MMQSMTKRQRTLLFSILLGLFFILAPAFALYSQGYRIDFAGGRIAQTGAFYFKVAPARADILVDGSFIKKTDFLFGSSLTKNFFPNSYFLEIAKEGYHSWQKILQIKEQRVTEAKSILLFKKDLAFQKLADKVERFWISPNMQYALLLQRESQAFWQINLLNLKTGGKEPLAGLINTKDEIRNIQWAQDSRRFLLLKTHNEQLVFEVRSILPNVPCFKTPCSLEYLGKDISSVEFSPAKEDQILFTKFLNTTQVLFEAQYSKKEPAIPIANNVVTFTGQGNHIFWLDTTGTLRKKDLGTNSDTQIFQESVFLPAKETAYELLIAGNTILIKENATLFLHKEKTSFRREVLSPVLEVVVNSNGNKVALQNQSELWILFLKKDTEQPQHEAGELILLTRFSKPPVQLFWIDSSYLLFGLGEIIKSVEIDNRDRLNIVDLISFPDPEFFWNNKKGTLYVLSKNAFFVSEKIVR